MNADKRHASRGVEGARRATVMPADESLQGAASPQPSVIVPPDHEGRHSQGGSGYQASI